MDDEYKQAIRPILDVFDKVRRILKDEEIDLPKIVVVGDQSSGKSSVLESITGISLPRGTGTVTKCPIIIQSRLAKTQSEEGAVISAEGQPDSNKVSLADLCSTITEYQDKLTSTFEITDTPIYVELNKLSAPDLTLYDLPGLKYKSGVTDKIRDLIGKYTKGKETIILLIIASNADFSTTEAIEIIQKHNLDYKERTILVLTKIDLGIQEKNLFEKIISNELELKFDPIVVRNRTQQEIDENVPIQDIRKIENDLIEDSDLRKLSKKSKGTSMLIDKLIEIQKDKLLTSRFRIHQKIYEKIAELKKLLNKLPKPVNTLSEKMDIFKECLAVFANNINNALENRCIYDSTKIKRNKTFNITYELKKIFEEDLVKYQNYHSYFLSDKFFELTSEHIKQSIGFSLPNFNEFKVFETIMKRELENNIEIESLMRKSQKVVLNFLLENSNESFQNYPEMCEATKNEIKNLVNFQYDESFRLVDELFTMEKNLIYTINPYYIDMVNKINKMKLAIKRENRAKVDTSFIVSDQEEDEEISYQEEDRDQKEIVLNVEVEKEMKKFLKAHYNHDMAVVNVQISCFAYWKVVEKRFVDYFHMIILNKLLYKFREMSNIFDKKFAPNTNEQAKNWIREDAAVTTKREQIEKSLDAFEEADKLMNTI
jgi:GTPase SAR1 family protein